MEQSKEVTFRALSLPAKPSEVTADRRIHVVLNSETSSLSRCPPTVFWYEYPNVSSHLGGDTSSTWNFCARISEVISLANQWWRRKMLACEQALLFGRVKRASRERASERRSTSLARCREAHFASPNWRAYSQATKCRLFSQAGKRAQQNLWGTRLLRSSLMTRGSISLTTCLLTCAFYL